MGQSEKHGAKGKLWLQRDWEESSSTRLEYNDDLYLEAMPEGKEVVLVHAHGKTNFIKRSETDYLEEKIKISATKLIELIREHGKKI